LSLTYWSLKYFGQSKDWLIAGRNDRLSAVDDDKKSELAASMIVQPSGGNTTKTRRK